MQPSVQPQRRLDELVLEALASFQIQRPPAPRESDASIEIVFGDDECDIAVTTQFVKFSGPYERVELDYDPSPTPVRARRTTFVKTINARKTEPMAVPVEPEPAPASETQAFEAVWFDASEDSLSRMVAADQQRRARSWLWLAISIATAAIATGVMLT